MTQVARTIKRYANRKLYDTKDSRYVTLDQIADMIREGEDIVVIDNSTKDDLTSVTLAQIIFEEEKRKESFLPLAALRKIIQGGGESLQDFVNQIHESAERVGRVFKPTKEEEDGVVEGMNESDNVEAKNDIHSTHIVKDFVENVQGTIDDWQKQINANIQNAIESMSPLSPLQKEVHRLIARIEELEQKISDLKS